MLLRMVCAYGYNGIAGKEHSITISPSPPSYPCIMQFVTASDTAVFTSDRYKKVMFLGGRAAVSNVGRVVDKIFRISGLYKIIEKYDTPVDAIKALE